VQCYSHGQYAHGLADDAELQRSPRKHQKTFCKTGVRGGPERRGGREFLVIGDKLFDHGAVTRMITPETPFHIIREERLSKAEQASLAGQLDQ